MTTIAVIGLNGALGKPVLEAAVSDAFKGKIQFPIKAISRSEQKSSNEVSYIKADLSETDKLAQELKGVDVIIELAGPSPDVFGNVEKLVAAVKPKLFIPSQFGINVEQVQKYAPGFLDLKRQHSKNVRDTGVKTVDIYTSLFAGKGGFLYKYVTHVGIDSEKNTYSVRGDITQPISYSSLKDIGYAVVAIATEKDQGKLPDQFQFHSGQITIKEIIAAYEKANNVELKKDGEISKEQALKDLQDALNKGFDPNQFLSYLHSIAAQGKDQGLSFSKADNELINPGEKVWKYTKY